MFPPARVAAAVTIITNAKVSRLLTAVEPQPIGTRVVGVAYTVAGSTEPKFAHADGVVLASGGYAFGNNALLRKWAPWLVGLPCTNGPFAVGDGVVMAEAASASLIHMNQVWPRGCTGLGCCRCCRCCWVGA